jgi:hypothetical protein
MDPPSSLASWQEERPLPTNESSEADARAGWQSPPVSDDIVSSGTPFPNGGYRGRPGEGSPAPGHAEPCLAAPCLA